MFILNILENGVEGITLEYPKNSTTNLKKIFFLNNIVAEKSVKRNERLDYLKKLNCAGFTFYIITEKDVQNIKKSQWDQLFNNLDSKNKKILHFIQNNKYTRSIHNKFNKKSKIIYNKKTKKIYKVNNI